ncbi:winged helix-turn-helix domain-containing protein [Streptomyces radicis]|uniref:Winged helix family transcriptional regulator n=1 Tax=Streptomyces radicis TaxID=1750517 RepID=A0A3A9VRF7_9ACTN|nr:winged helix-turn-helix domain-containing protein [Streptomyces radicis]RKN03310.1 winged helix family transcriptional regulator [Streptomyces radicis]RKN13185.1 winged helix family transcriptional regulator [Streptomyces radicis]
MPTPRHLAALPTPPDLSRLSSLSELTDVTDVTVTLVPQALGGGTADNAVPLVGYLVLAPAGTKLTQLGEILSAASQPPAPTPVRAPEAKRRSVAVDTDERTATVDGKPLRLTYLEFELLAHLVRHPHRVYTREQLVATIWGYGPVGDQRTVDVHIARLRRKLGAAYRERIVTVRRVGYKYVPPPGG